MSREADTDGTQLRQALADMTRARDVAALRAGEAERRCIVLAAELTKRETFLQQVFESRSWRFSTPLRVASLLAQRQTPPATHSPPPELTVPPISQPSRRTIFIECTHTSHTDLNTGIQRVVRNILRNAGAVAAEHGYDVVPVTLQNGQFIFADLGRVLADKQGAPVCPVKAPPPAQPGGLLARAARRAQNALRHASPPRPPAAMTNHAAASRIDDYQRLNGSILLLLDSSWALPIWPPTQRFKARGGVITGAIFDLIPLTHGHTCFEELIVAFRLWLNAHLQVTDGFACISKTVADTLAVWIDDTRQNNLAQIGHFHLGSELDLISPADAVRPATREVFAPERHVFLMVGSIEPRKMHSFVLDAFDRFWAAGGIGALVVIGRHGWKFEQFLARCAAHEQTGSQLFLLRDATDAELDHAYDNASALIIASEIEGFGLPVVEAFQRGLPVICSDIPVFREIADGRAVFFDLGAPDMLADALHDFCGRVTLETRRERMQQGWIGWRESAGQLIRLVVGFSQRVELGEARASEGKRVLF